jgi:hypothetical protein
VLDEERRRGERGEQADCRRGPQGRTS